MESFSALTEFAVAIAGFSGITIAIQARGGAPDAIARFRNKNLITWSLCAAFGASFPQAAFHLGARGPGIWAWSSLLYALFLTLVILVPFMSRATLTLAERARLSPVIWVVGIGGTGIIAACLLANAAGWFGEPNSGPLYLAVLWMIFFASLQFYRLLFAPDAIAAE